MLFCGGLAAQDNSQSGDLNTNTQGSVVDPYNETTNNSKTYNGAGSSSQMPAYNDLWNGLDAVSNPLRWHQLSRGG